MLLGIFELEGIPIQVYDDYDVELPHMFMISLIKDIKITGFSCYGIDCMICSFYNSDYNCTVKMSDIIYNRYSSQFPEYLI